ncbi:nitrilase-related carbon-nitrogen hydrolase [Promethearchaeum syntrophicum]|uniref:Nitrilase-related carbon-nitrogen hydrolase n=1 Tax=Promethearchaeum syntrophicum TaxID=2594042 RepID=A0A5B9DBK3_9ARCH|nr:nitrilase-related carbon-nitrogen hydrolase [Candidatus Prometheoarchaeum syntrophicum]QEE16502.1 C-N hydrolase family amidase [Candidatus Prometheoarchaeum syntrophicum]
MKVGYIQLKTHFGEKQKNFNKVADLLKDVDDADIVVLPELFATGYTFKSIEEVQSLSESKDGETSKFLQKMAKRTNAVFIGGFVEKFENKLFNSAMMVSKEEVIDIYRKLHLFNKEKKWFSPGNTKLTVNNIKGTKVGMMICFDWTFPEVTRTLSLLGAEIIAHPANLVLPYCQNAMKTRCFCNRLYAITANRIGVEQRGEDSFEFTGRSQITSYSGEILSSAPSDAEFVDIVEIFPKKTRNKNINQFNNVHEDRREKFYWNNL